MGYKNSVSVRVCGKTMTLTGNESVEYMTKVADYIEQKAEEIRNSDNSRALNANLISVLTSLNIADDYFKMKEKKEALEQQMEQLKQMEEADPGSIEEMEQKNRALCVEEQQLMAKQKELEEEIFRQKEQIAALEEEKKSLQEAGQKKDETIRLLEEDLKKQIAKINHIKSVEYKRQQARATKYNQDGSPQIQEVQRAPEK
ncbi:MAG TPA: cell division protein ZapA [Firmicutes bacterium]|nr:cell division protein ZapA [Bacillota bacterium]